MTIKQQGGVFGRNPTFNEVEAADITVTNTLGVNTSAPQRVLDVLAGVSNTGVAHFSGSFSDRGLFLSTAVGGTRSDGAVKYNASSGASGSTGQHQFLTDDGLVATIKSVGIALENGKGIDFSATAGTGTSELFDDYEEGTWTPTLYGSGGGSATIGTINLATYTKVGNTVHLVAYLGGIDLSTHTIVGNVRLGGLPYNTVQFSGVAAATYCNMFTFDEKTTGVSAYANVNHFQFMQGSSAALITATELGAGATSLIMFSATYTAS